MYAIRSYYGLRHRELARVAARDLAGLATLAEVMADLSALASASLAGAVGFARRHLSERYGAAVIETRITSYNVCYTKLLRLLFPSRA